MKIKHNVLNRYLSRLLKNNAVSSTISLLLVLMVFFSATSVVFYWGPKYIESEENKHQTQATVQQYNSIVEILNDLIANGNGSSSNSDIVINEGTIEIDSEGDKIIIAYSFDPDWDFNSSIDNNILEIIMTNGQDVDKVIFYWLENTCFLAGTKITMTDGSTKNIEEIKVGDIVRSYDINNDEIFNSRVIKLLSYNKELMDEYYLIINNRLRVTPNHKLFVNNKWIDAGKICVGDDLFDISGHKSVLLSVKKMFSKEISYDLLLESGDNYFADGFLAKSDVEKIHLSDNIIVSKMSVAPVKLSPLGTQNQPPSTPQHTYPLEFQKIATADTHISAYNPGGTFGSAVNLIVDPWHGIINDYRNRVLINTPFSESDIEEYSYIVDANLNIRYYTWDAVPTGWPRYHDLYECAYPWSEGSANWNTEQNNFRVSNPGILDTVTIPQSPFGYKQWDVTDSIQKFVGYGGCCPDFLLSGQYENFHGWYLKDSDESVGTLKHVIKYRSKDYDNDKPYLYVEFIEPPTIETWNPTNVGTDSATLEAKLTYDGGEETDCYFKWGYDSLSYTTSKLYDRKDYTTSALISIPISNLNSGDLVKYKAYAENSAHKKNNYGIEKKFITIPPSPTNLEEASSGSGPTYLKVIWDEGAVEGSGQDVYTKVLCKEGSYPTYDEDLTNPNVKAWKGMQEYHTFYGLEENTCYYFRAYTNVTEDGLWQRNNVPDQCIICTSSNNPPNKPSTPTGVTPVDVGVPHSYETSAIDSDGDSVSYRFNWNASGIPEYSSWSSWVSSGTPVSMDHSWSSPGIYEVKAQARDPDSPPYSLWSDPLIVTVNGGANNPPTAKISPKFFGNLNIGELGEFKIDITDPENDQIQYRINWDVDGIGDITDWSDLSDPGTFVESHSWPSSGKYNISAQARDQSGGGEGAWSEKCEVNVGGELGKPDTLGLPYSIFYNETAYTFGLTATEDDVYYMFDFGDESGVTDWIGPYNKDDTVEADHAWEEKGVFEVRVKAKKDTTGYETEWSDPQALKVLYKYVVPPDIIEVPESVTPDSPGSNTFTASQNLDGAVCIHLFNDNYPPTANPVDKGKIPFGIIYLFDQGSIVHKIPSSSGDIKTVLQSGGIMTVLPDGPHINSYSNIYENGDILGFTVTMIRSNAVISGSGAGTFGLNFENKDTFTREQQESRVYNFKIKITGEYSSTWNEYLTRNFKFDSQSGQFSDFLVYDDYSAKQLVFSTALIKTDLQQ